MSDDLDESTLLMTPLKDREHLQAWLQHFLGFTLPDCAVTSVATSTPLDFVWKVYSAAMDGKPLNITAIAGRDGAKTLSLSVVDALLMLHDLRPALHSAMTKAQASRAREYLQSFLYKIPLLKSSIVKENNSVIELKIGENTVSAELISLTPKAVQGAHYPLVSVDELASSMDPQQIKAYRDLSGVPGTHKLNGKPAIIIKITSRQSGASLAEQEIRSSHKTGVEVVYWTTIDTMRKCPPERSGTTKVPVNVNLTKGLAYRDEEFAALSEPEKEGFTRSEDTMDGCHKCPLLMYCQGKARHQTSDSPILRSIDDVIGKVNAAASHEWVLSQIMSCQPSSEGLVYPEFSPAIHVPSWESLWQTLTGSEPVSAVNRESFMRELKRRGATFLAGVDFGYTHPATCVVVAIDKKENVYVVEALGMVRKDDPEWVEIIKDKIHSQYRVEMYCPDSENPSGISLMRKADLPVAEIDKGKGSVKAGVNVIKGLLRVPGTNNRTRFFICPDIGTSNTSIPSLIEEFTLYSKDIDAAGNVIDDRFVKENDHHCDALRYVLYWYFGKASVRAVFSDSSEAMRPDRVAPTGTQMAEMSGVQYIDNRDEVPTGHNDDDDDPDGSGGGGLMVAWT